MWVPICKSSIEIDIMDALLFPISLNIRSKRDHRDMLLQKDLYFSANIPSRIDLANEINNTHSLSFGVLFRHNASFTYAQIN